jgi:hypothetical protein
VDVYLQFEHGEELQSIAFKGRVRLRVDFNAIGPVVAIEPIDGAAVIEVEVEGLPEAGYELREKLPSLEVGPVWCVDGVVHSQSHGGVHDQV